jgi:hypothetical protein
MIKSGGSTPGDGQRPAPSFDPVKVAYYEKAGWQAYYDRNWLLAFRLMVRLNREEFNLSLPVAILAAMDIVRSSMAFAPLDNDVQAATEHLHRYYEKARRSVGIPADAETLARLEMDYWIVHRRLALERIQDHDLDNIGPMVDSLTTLHAALFGAEPEATRRSAEYRALAAQSVDRITGRYSTDVSRDWELVESYLQQAYHELAVHP